MLLAKAFPNRLYENIRSIHFIILEAHLINKKIIYYEKWNNKPDHMVKVKESTVFDMFGRSNRVKEKPFLKKENIDFYSVLFRRLNLKCNKRYVELKRGLRSTESIETVFKRTKKPNFKRTK
jgi:hypothetical protein